MEDEKQLRLAYKHVFLSSFGDDVLRDLEATFGSGSCFHNDPLIMAKLASQRDVVEYIKELIK